MKLIIFALVAVLAVTTINAQHFANSDLEFQDDINFLAENPSLFDDGPQLPGFVQKIIQKVIDWAQKQIERLQKQLDKLVEKAISELFRLVDLATQNSANIVRDTKAKLVMSGSENSQECSQKYVPLLESALAEAKQEGEKCVVSALKKVSIVREEAQVHIDSITGEVLNLAAIAKNCTSLNPIYTTKCVLEHLKEIRGSLKEIISNAYNGIKDASFDLVGIVTDARHCVHKSNKETEEHVKSVAKKAEDCLKNGPEIPEKPEEPEVPEKPEEPEVPEKPEEPEVPEKPEEPEVPEKPEEPEVPEKPEEPEIPEKPEEPEVPEVPEEPEIPETPEFPEGN